MEAPVEGFRPATQQSDEQIFGLRKGPWTDEEDALLNTYVAIHGEGSWNTVARSAGLKRTGKSCRLRWLNYLRPDVRRGNITLQEQFMILQLHSRWGNRWSKIAEHLPGRTDNEIKNYWRTRVQKQAKQLKCDVNSKQFRDALRYVWMPRLLERIQATSNSYSAGQPAAPYTETTSNYADISPSQLNHNSESGSDPNFIPELSGSSSDSFDARSHDQVSPGSELTGDFNSHGHTNYIDNSENGLGLDIQGFEQQQNNGWLGGGDSLESMWIDENIWFLQQQLCDD